MGVVWGAVAWGREAGGLAGGLAGRLAGRLAGGLASGLAGRLAGGLAGGHQVNVGVQLDQQMMLQHPDDHLDLLSLADTTDDDNNIFISGTYCLANINKTVNKNNSHA